MPDAPPVGTTVTMRVTTPIGSITVVGVLESADPAGWDVRRRDGTVMKITPDTIDVWRVVPPSKAQLASVEEVTKIAALGWRAPESARLGEWLLRAGGGFTGRANSALALGDPGVDLDAAIDAVTRWYADRDLPPRMQLTDPGAPAGLAAALERIGWLPSPAVHVMTAEIGHVLRAAPVTTDLELRVDDAPDDGWLGCYRQDGGALPAVARDILVDHPNACFASARDGGRVVAIARAAIDQRWAGLFAVEVTPEHRHVGLGRAVSAAALRWAGQRGARRTYLQVSVDNEAAVALYLRLGYTVHHDYRYWQRPG